jgi:hypothetical protein
MLISKGTSIGEIVTIRTNAGEEIIGRFYSEDDKFITLNKPRALIPTQKGVDLAPFMFTVSSDTVLFAKHAIMTAPLATEKDAADLYIQRTTGISLM